MKPKKKNIYIYIAIKTRRVLFSSVEATLRGKHSRENRVKYVARVGNRLRFAKQLVKVYTTRSRDWPTDAFVLIHSRARARESREGRRNSERRSNLASRLSSPINKEARARRPNLSPRASRVCPTGRSSGRGTRRRLWHHFVKTRCAHMPASVSPAFPSRQPERTTREQVDREGQLARCQHVVALLPH